jgi:hypothetical protein
MPRGFYFSQVKVEAGPVIVAIRDLLFTRRYLGHMPK